MRRALWTAGMGLVGFYLSYSSAYLPGSSVWNIVGGTAWGASIGFGFGTIFDQKRSGKRIIIYWASTLALVGPFFGLLIGSLYSSQILAGAIGAVAGGLLGLLTGTLHFRHLRRILQP